MNNIRIVKSGARIFYCDNGKYENICDDPFSTGLYQEPDTPSIQSPFTPEEAVKLLSWDKKKWDDVFGLYLINEFHGAGFNLSGTLLVTGKPWFDYLREKLEVKK